MTDQSPPPQPVHIAIVLYEGMTALDAIGPLDVLRFLPGAQVDLVAERAGPVRTDGPLELSATSSYEDVPRPDVVVVPGGPGTEAALGSPLVSWLSQVHTHTRWTTPVCSGSLLLAAAGLLADRPAASQFAVLELLPLFGAKASTERVVVLEADRIMTAAGVSSGIDMALHLAARLAGEETARANQLIIEYDPHPPFDAGSLASASPGVIARAMALGRPHGAIPQGWQPSDD